MNKYEIAVLIPCYNEEKTIKKVIGDFKLYLPNSKIYVYDNNSTDNTAMIALNEGAIVVNEYRQGKGNVVRSMFRDINADCYLMVDGDDTYPAECAKDMVELIISKKADMVIGDRLSSTYFNENKRLFHNSGNRLVRMLINKFFNGNINDIMTGYRAFNRKFVKSFPVISKGFEIETEMTIHAMDKNMLLYEIPVQYRDRPEGSVSKLNTFKDGFRVLKTIISLFKDYKPFLFFSTVSLFIFFLGLFLFIPVFIEYIEKHIVLRFPTLLVSLFLIFSSLLSFSCGLILSTLQKMQKQEYEIQLNQFEYLDKINLLLKNKVNQFIIISNKENKLYKGQKNNLLKKLK